MAATLTQHLADFTAATSYENLPDEVADDSKRVLLDSIGCALAAVDEPRGRIGIEYAGLQGGTDESATVLGSDKRSSVFGAGFANGELINTLDFDAALPIVETHPDYVTALEANPAARPTRVEVTARGTTHTAERSFPKGSPSPDPATYATTDDLVDKSRHNASGMLSEADTDHAVETLLNLETAADVRAVLRALPPFPFAPVAPDDLESHGPDGDKDAADRGRTHRPRRILGPGRAGARGRPVARPGSRPGRAARPA
ncbi:MmgE/PrpD family protein [Streptomyces incanus]|uniref:MmgE/PrpD family protein n=1 Tax=Streptomyces incanus TaxID=887453 RepID=A0ABW0XTH9_9ACTN